MAYEKKPAVDKVCRYCKNTFSTTRSRQVYCSEICKTEFVRAILTLGQCPHCGKELLNG